MQNPSPFGSAASGSSPWNEVSSLSRKRARTRNADPLCVCLQEIKVWKDTKERRTFEDLSDLYAIIKVSARPK
jgi:hypothetical protein